MIHRVGRVSSTMDLLHQWAGEGAGPGTIVVAEEQIGGRGSRGRAWRSPPGGLWLSTLLHPASAAGIELLSLRAGLAVAAAVEASAPEITVGIKWPNDLMLDGRKLGGLLCEARWQGEALAWVVLGVGLNVANSIPADLQATATALAEHVPGIRPDTVLPEVAARLEQLSGSDRLSPDELADLAGRDWLAGRRLRAPAAGVAAGIAPDGSLLIRSAEGTVTAIRAGGVELAGSD